MNLKADTSSYPHKEYHSKQRPKLGHARTVMNDNGRLQQEETDYVELASPYIQARELRSLAACGRPLVGVGGLCTFNS